MARKKYWKLNELFSENEVFSYKNSPRQLNNKLISRTNRTPLNWFGVPDEKDNFKWAKTFVACDIFKPVIDAPCIIITAKWTVCKVPSVDKLVEFIVGGNG